MAGASRPVAGGAYSGPRSEPGGQNTPRAGRSVAALGTYINTLGTFWQQIDQGNIFDERASGVITAGAPASSGVLFTDDFEDGDLAGWNSAEQLIATFTSSNDAAVGHNSSRGLQQITNATGSGLRRRVDNSWTYTDTTLQFWLYMHASPTGSFATIAWGRDSGGGTLYQLYHVAPNPTAGQPHSRLELNISNSGGFVTTLISANDTVPLDTWVYVKIRMKAEAAGQASLTVDGVLGGSYSGDLSRSLPFAQIQLWADPGNVALVYDDVQVLHDSEAPVIETSVYSDSGAGTVTASGSGSESASATESAAATVTASGSGVEGLAYTDAATATATASGSGTESYIISSGYNDSGTAVITASGSATESSASSDSSVGTVTSSGARSDTLAYTDSGSAIAIANGTGAESYVVSYNDAASAIVSASGTATEVLSFSDSSTATGTVSGSRVEDALALDSASATLSAAGTGSDSSIQSAQGSGSIAISGTGVESYATAAGYTDSASGALTTAGSGADSYTLTDAATVTITVGGAANEVYAVDDSETANVTAKGTGSEVAVRDSTASGLITLSGFGVEFVGEPLDRSDITWSLRSVNYPAVAFRVSAPPLVRMQANGQTLSISSTRPTVTLANGQSPPRVSLQGQQPVKAQVVL